MKASTETMDVIAQGARIGIYSLMAMLLASFIGEAVQQSGFAENGPCSSMGSFCPAWVPIGYWGSLFMFVVGALGVLVAIAVSLGAFRNRKKVA